MDEVRACTDSLIRAIQSGKVYQRYLDCKRRLEENPDLKAQVDKFRLYNYRMQNSGHEIDLYSESDKLTALYEEIRKNSIIDEFLEYELKVCKMIQQINFRIVQSVDLGISMFIDEISL